MITDRETWFGLLLCWQMIVMRKLFFKDAKATKHFSNSCRIFWCANEVSAVSILCKNEGTKYYSSLTTFLLIAVSYPSLFVFYFVYSRYALAHIVQPFLLHYITAVTNMECKSYFFLFRSVWGQRGRWRKKLPANFQVCPNCSHKKFPPVTLSW